jgi:lipoprotein-releasing system permease protein
MISTNLKIAKVHLTTNTRQTLVALLGVTFGICMYIFMNSFMSGVNDTQTDLAFTSLAHIRIYNDGPEDNTNIVRKTAAANTAVNIRNGKIIQYTTGIKNTAAIMSLVRHQPEVTGTTPQVNIDVFFRNGGNKINGTLSGVDVQNEDHLFNMSKYMVTGVWSQLQYRPDGIFLGADLAKDLSVNLDDNINLLTSDGVSHNYKLIGIFRTNVKSTDNSKAYINISAARQLENANQEYVTDIQVNIRDYEKTAPVVDRISPVIPYRTESWQTANQQLEAGNKLRNIVAVAVSLTILLVAGFGIYNIMNMTINEKIREIAILKAMGFSGVDIKQIFLAQAIVIGVLGGWVGMVFGFVIADAVNHVPFKVAGLDHLPMTYHSGDYIMAFVFGLITTIIAGWLPARKASKVDPVQIIRG